MYRGNANMFTKKLIQKYSLAEIRYALAGASDDDIARALLLACQTDRVDVVEEILVAAQSRGIVRKVLTAKDNIYNCSAFAIICHRFHAISSMAKKLLDVASANRMLAQVLMVRDVEEHTPFHAACFLGHRAIVEAILDVVQNDEKMLERVLIATDVEGVTSFYAACMGGDVVIVEKLLQIINTHDNLLERILMKRMNQGASFYWFVTSALNALTISAVVKFLLACNNAAYEKFSGLFLHLQTLAAICRSYHADGPALSREVYGFEQSPVKWGRKYALSDMVTKGLCHGLTCSHSLMEPRILMAYLQRFNSVPADQTTSDDRKVLVRINRLQRRLSPVIRFFHLHTMEKLGFKRKSFIFTERNSAEKINALLSEIPKGKQSFIHISFRVKDGACHVVALRITKDGDLFFYDSNNIVGETEVVAGTQLIDIINAFIHVVSSDHRLHVSLVTPNEFALEKEKFVAVEKCSKERPLHGAHWALMNHDEIADALLKREKKGKTTVTADEYPVLTKILEEKKQTEADEAVAPSYRFL